MELNTCEDTRTPCLLDGPCLIVLPLTILKVSKAYKLLQIGKARAGTRSIFLSCSLLSQLFFWLLPDIIF